MFVRLCSLVELSITERSIAFDWQIFLWVRLSSITEPNGTQSSDWVRLGLITERSIDYAENYIASLQATGVVLSP